MRAFRRVGLIVLLAVLALTGGLLPRRPREPVYQNKPLSLWLEAACNGSDRARYEAYEAALHSGSNAIPVLMKWMRAEDSQARLAFIKLAGRQSVFRVHFTPASDRRRLGTEILRRLGPKARPAMAELIELLQTPDGDFAANAAQVLAAIGPDAAEPLARALTNESSRVRAGAALVLGGGEPDDGRAGLD